MAETASQIPAPRVQFIDERTGLISREWYMWLLTVTGGGKSALVTAVTALSPLVSSGGSAPQISLEDSGVTPGEYDSPTLTVSDKGIITAIEVSLYAKWGIVIRSVAADETMTIPAGYQAIFAGDFTNEGTIINSGNRLII